MENIDEIFRSVLFFGKIRHPMTEYTEGINTYRVIPLIMKNRNADQYLKELCSKVERDQNLTKQDLISLALCPLMDGEMEQKERIKTAFSITH